MVESCKFHLTKPKLSELTRLEVTVVDCDRLGNSHPIGQINFQQLRIAKNGMVGYRRSSVSQIRTNTLATRVWREAIDGRQSRPCWIALEQPMESPSQSPISLSTAASSQQSVNG